MSLRAARPVNGNLSRGSSLCPVVNIGRGRTSGYAMASEDTYQQRASECFRLAEDSIDEKERNTWRELALCWLRLSEHAQGFRRVGRVA